MTQVVLRWIGESHVSSAVPGVVIPDTRGHVLFQPAGSDHGSATGRRGGPRERNMVPGGWDGGHEIRAWTGDGVLRVHREGDPWSTWRWFDPDAGTWSPYAYVNLEDPWHPTALGFDSRDWILDLVFADDGTVFRKDEDELAWALEVGRIGTADHARILAAAEGALRAHGRGEWPFAQDWDVWADSCRGGGALRLPPTWTDSPTSEWPPAGQPSAEQSVADQSVAGPPNREEPIAE